MAQMTPFELFGLKPAFKVDLEALHAAHERAILQVHPDRFADRPAADKVLEALSSAIDETHDWDKAVDLTRRLMFIERFLEQNAD